MKKELLDLVKKYYGMEKGEHIKNFQESSVFYDGDLKINITNRALKHIVESRKMDSYKLEELESLLLDMYILLENKSYTILANKKENESSFLFVEVVLDKSKGVIIVAELFLVKEKEYFIKTSFYKPASKIKKLLKTKNSP